MKMLPGTAPGGGTASGRDGWGATGYMRFGILCVLLLGGGFGTWAATASLASAVIATGQLRVETNRQVVQHPDGGVVGAIAVRDGDVVSAGDLLIQLDDTLLLSEVAVLESQLYELMARRGRLEAAQLDDPDIRFDPELIEVASARPDVNALMTGQVALYGAQRETMAKEEDVLVERAAQLDEQAAGAEAEITSLERQSALIEEELVDKRALLERGLIQKPQVLSLEREAARLLGQAGQLRSQVARIKGQKAELEVERLRIKTTMREQSLSELRELGFKELELKQRRLALREQIDRLDIRAPVPGTVFDMTIHAVKSVVRPAEPVLYVVPNNSELVVDAQLEPINRDQVTKNQAATLRFSAFNSRTTPEIFGHVVTVSPDAIVNEQTGRSFFKVEIGVDDGELVKLDGQELVAGMPVEVYIQTGERTALNYLMKPMTDYFNKALRED